MRRFLGRLSMRCLKGANAEQLAPPSRSSSPAVSKRRDSIPQRVLRSVKKPPFGRFFDRLRPRRTAAYYVQPRFFNGFFIYKYRQAFLFSLLLSSFLFARKEKRKKGEDLNDYSPGRGLTITALASRSFILPDCHLPLLWAQGFPQAFPYPDASRRNSRTG